MLKIEKRGCQQNAKKSLHIGFDDPTYATGTDEFVWSEYIHVRNEIQEAFLNLYEKSIKPYL